MSREDVYGAVVGSFSMYGGLLKDVANEPRHGAGSAPSSQTPWIVDFLWHANPWVIVIGALVLFFLARTVVRSIIMALARHVTLVIKMAWEALTGRR